MTENPFPGSTQKELWDAKRSASAKYRDLVVGRRGWGAFLKYELIQLFVAPVPGALGLALRRIFYPLLLGGCGRGVVFGRNVVLRHPHRIRIGDHTVIDDGAVLDAKGSAKDGLRIGAHVLIGRNTILTCKEGSIRIGDYGNISAHCHMLSETVIELGTYCFLAGNCFLVAGGNHPITDVRTPIMLQPSTVKGGIHIGDDVWLGAGVTVLDGVTIGTGSVVGAGAVITASLPEYSYAVADRRLRLSDRRSLGAI